MGGSEYRNPTVDSRFADASGAWQAVCDTSVADWVKTDEFWVACYVECNVHNGCISENFKLQWSKDDVAWNDLTSSGEIKQASGLNDPGTAGCNTTVERGVVQGGDNFTFAAMGTKGDFGEMVVAVSSDDGLDSQIYYFRLFSTTGNASLATNDATLTTEAGAVTEQVIVTTMT